MTVERLFISHAPKEALQECTTIQLERGQGIVGDRHFGRSNWAGQNLTLVEAEEIERFCAETQRPKDLSITRRNVVTRGVRLNDLVGKTFTIGSARLHGVELCEPCGDLGRSLARDDFPAAAVVKRWLGRGGLRATVIDSGVIDSGDRLTIDA